MLSLRLEAFPRIKLLNGPTPLEKLERLSKIVGRDIYVKRDDLTPFALGGNKLRKLEYLAADAIKNNADTLITAGAIQSNHVRQTAAVAARLGLKSIALLENPIGSTDRNYLSNGNRLLLDLFDTEVQIVANLDHAQQDLQNAAEASKARGLRPYVVPIGGSNPLGTLGYVQSGLEIARQAAEQQLEFDAVFVASGSAGTHAGLALALSNQIPQSRLIGVSVSRPRSAQASKVKALLEETIRLTASNPVAAEIEVWDEYYAPRYGSPNQAGNSAIKLLASSEGLLLDPVYTGKTMAGLLDGLDQGKLPGHGPILFVHTGGSPALFAYHPASA